MQRPSHSRLIFCTIFCFLAAAFISLVPVNGVKAFQKKPTIQQKGKDPSKALIYAVTAGRLAEVKTLIERGADVNVRGSHGLTPLMWAAMGGKTEIANVLIAAKADINAKDEDGRTALSHATEWGNTEIADLLKNAVKLDPAEPSEGLTGKKGTITNEVIEAHALSDEVKDRLESQDDPMRAYGISTGKAQQTSSAGSASKTVYVKGHSRKDGAYVQGHTRSAPRSSSSSSRRK